MWNILCGGLLLFFQLTFVFRKTEMAFGPKTGMDNNRSLKMNLDLAMDLPFKDSGNQTHFEEVVKKGRNL